MPLIDEREFIRGRKHASAHWLEACEDDVAEAFMHMRLSACKFGMDARSRTAWCKMGRLLIGLKFQAETGEYETSFFKRQEAKP
ncbi:MAG: hypothetical protein ACYS22_13635 [Planctomycetota bacterium]